jgi:hypothetical protein
MGPKRGGKKNEIYSFTEAKNRLKPDFIKTALALDELLDEACPMDFGVACLTLNPAYIAKSYFPIGLLRATGLESVGSRTIRLKPEKWAKKGIPHESLTTQLFVAGKRHTFRELAERIETIEEGSNEARDLTHIEKFSTFAPRDRIKTYNVKEEHFFEVGLHLLQDEESFPIRLSFEKFTKKYNVKIYTNLAFQAGNLWFVPVEGASVNVEKLSEFVFVRLIRPMPKLRGMRPVTRASVVTLGCSLPTEPPLSSEPKVAILDGGLPENHTILPWLNSYRLLDPTADSDPSGLEHGLAVTSAFLFGPIQPHGIAQRPFAYVDHLRVLDKKSETEDPLELYRTLGLIEEVLLSRQYEFINLSLGPDLPIEDTDVHAWTSVIDDLLSDGNTFMTVAIGNNGERDKIAGNARVQVPSDCVNAVAVGAANNTNSSWARAPYSTVGPGRSPGIVKPDLMAFGGDTTEYFHVLSESKKPILSPQLGTSFASPYLLRSAVGIRAILQTGLSPLAIKALLIHGADPSNHDKSEVGWGKIPEDLMAIITCEPGVARIIYQGELKPGKYLRAHLPIPRGGLTGRIRLKATFCYASPTDPQDVCSYTRAGLDVIFRPNKGHLKSHQSSASPKAFFSTKKYSTEEERRSDMGKWETVLHGEKPMLGSSLNDPVFDIHYNAREAGGKSTGTNKIRYALVLTVEAPNHANLYNDILQAYNLILTPIEPQASLPVRV